MMGKALIFGLAVLAGAMAAAEDHHVPARPGAAQALIASGDVAPGDRILLASGDHGALTIRGRAYAAPVTLMADPGATPVLSGLTLMNSSGWRVQGLTITPGGARLTGKALVEVTKGRDIVLDGLTVFSAPSAKGWTKADWQARAHGGIRVSGRDITVRGSHVRIVKHGIDARADGALVENNVIELFAWDGMRGLGDNSVYRGNRVETCVNIDKNHDDAFQAWSRDALGRPGKGVIRNVRVENNVFVTGDMGGDMTCYMQGIGLFDGIYEDWEIRGNTVIVDHWHGITVMGGRRVTIADNIVVDARPGTRRGPPWITITNHKDGRRAENGVISGNVSQKDTSGDKLFSQPRPGVTLSGNRIVATPQQGLALRE